MAVTASGYENLVNGLLCFGIVLRRSTYIESSKGVDRAGDLLVALGEQDVDGGQVVSEIRVGMLEDVGEALNELIGLFLGDTLLWTASVDCLGAGRRWDLGGGDRGGEYQCCCCDGELHFDVG